MEGGCIGSGKRLIVGVDTVGVLRRLGKGKGFCEEGEQLVRVGKRMLDRG